MSTDLVSVVIPAYNASATLDETLQSVRAQTYKTLEILVVDDGSRDDTVAIAERHAAADPRVRVIQQENAGVAAARNRGWAEARADFLAFVDADDLWHATKIERQLAALKADDGAGLAYCWYVAIDENNVVIRKSVMCRCEGDVFDIVLTQNFIGNGSAVLVRREALEYARGFESGLRAAGAQGCEDHLFACRVAEKYRFALVPDHLVGYRQLPDNMSSDSTRMLRSWILATEELKARHPEKTALLRAGLNNYASWLVTATLVRSPKRVLPILAEAFAVDPTLVVSILVSSLLTSLNLGARYFKRDFKRAARWMIGLPAPRGAVQYFVVGDGG